MRKQQEPTKAARYFVDLFECANLDAAIERAANSERAQLFTDCDRIPVDVLRLALTKGIQVEEDEIKTSCQEGKLVPQSGGFRVILRRSSTETRKRFSLAHELGHVLFYGTGAQRPRHQIGILSNSEREAEERICDRFAGALLMPKEQFIHHLSGFAPQCPVDVLRKLDSTARHFKVSVPACLARLRTVDIESPPYVLVCLSPKPNPATGKDVTLRVDSCVSIGAWRSAHIWHNKSVARIGLRSTTMLYESWGKRSLAAPVSGCFSLNQHEGILPVASNATEEVSEQVHISRITRGKWTNELAYVRAANWLYAWTNGSDRRTYVITVLAPLSSPMTTSS